MRSIGGKREGERDRWKEGGKEKRREEGGREREGRREGEKVREVYSCT